jgi:superfamily I DNA/RNA helicase
VAWTKNTAPFAKYDQLLDIAAAKNIGPEDYQEKEGWTVVDICRLAEAAMLLSKQPDAKNRISFNDQLWLPVVMGWVRPWFELLVVDECQDLNATQLLMIEKAVKPSGRLVLVGDKFQCIYGFRGADPKGFEKLKTKLRAKVMTLTTTYRCPKSVVDFVSKMVPGYKAAATAPDGIIRRVAEAQGAFTTALQGGDAVISRVNAPLMPLCLKLLQRGQRAYIEGRDIGKTLNGIHEKVKTADIKSYVEALDTWAAAKIEKVQGIPGSETYEAAIQVICDQAETLKALALADDVKTPDQVAAKLTALFADSEFDTNPVKPVVFTSVHKAKGLEWKRCFLLTATFKKVNWDLPAQTEESRIGYVAATRTKSELVWVDPVNTVPPAALEAESRGRLVLGNAEYEKKVAQVTAEVEGE